MSPVASAKKWNRVALVLASLHRLNEWILSIDCLVAMIGDNPIGANLARKHQSSTLGESGSHALVRPFPEHGNDGNILHRGLDAATLQ